MFNGILVVVMIHNGETRVGVFFCEIAQDELAVYQEQFFVEMFGDELLNKLPSILGILHEKNSMSLV